MTWYVKSRNADGSKNRILCDRPEDVRKVFEDQTARGLTTTIEDVQEREIDPAQFGIESKA